MWDAVHKPVKVVVYIVLAVIIVTLLVLVRDFLGKIPWISYSVFVLILAYAPFVFTKKSRREFSFLSKNLDEFVGKNQYNKLHEPPGCDRYNCPVMAMYKSSMKVRSSPLLIIAFGFIWIILFGSYSPTPDYFSNSEGWQEAAVFQQIAIKHFGYTWSHEGYSVFEFFNTESEILFYIIVCFPLVLMLVVSALIHDNYSKTKIRLCDLCNKKFKTQDD